MKAFCKNNYRGFEKGKYYKIIDIHTIFEKDDFITIKSNENIEHSWYRFRLNKSLEYIDNYIGQNEVYFYDYFSNINEERRKKLKQLKTK